MPLSAKALLSSLEVKFVRPPCKRCRATNRIRERTDKSLRLGSERKKPDNAGDAGNFIPS